MVINFTSEEKYEIFLVALFDDDLILPFKIFKRYLQKYKLYKNSPNLYISICGITNPDLEKLDVVISKIMFPYKKFKVNISNSINLSENFTQVNLKVEDKGYIYRLARTITILWIYMGLMLKARMIILIYEFCC